MFKNDLMNGVDYKRFVRYFYDPQPKYDDQSGTPIWFLGHEYASGPPPKPVSTVDHDDVVEVESSTDSHAPSDITTNTSSSAESQSTAPTNTSSFEDATHVDGENVPSLSNDPLDGGWPPEFLDDFESRIWMTYRSSFPPIPRSQDPSASFGISFSVRLRNMAEREGFSSDTGWGCMIRSGQSLLANALVILQLGRDWRVRKGQTPSSGRDEAHILALFADDPKAPFSIHRFVQHGASACGTHPGQWFGPSATASCIKELSAECAAAGLRVYVTPNTSDVYEDRFRSIASSAEVGVDKTFKPTLVLLGIRLGPDRITPVYYEALKSALTYPQSIGIAGGRPSSSHYFVGCQGDTFFYLDPHITQPALPFHPPASEPAGPIYTDEELASVHTRRLRALRISEMDPSMLIGFLIKDETDWEDWKRRIHEVKGKPIVNIWEKEPPVPGQVVEREGAVDEVETFDDDDDEDDDDDDTPTEVGDS